MEDWLGSGVLVLIFGTRPEAIKLGPVAARLSARKIPFQVLCTNQHTDLLAGTPAETDLAGSVSLGLSSTGQVVEWTQTAEQVLRATLRSMKPHLVVVQGDTMTAVAGARAASGEQIPIAHVEAGVRSGNLDEPWPEEGFRVEIAQLVEWHYAPTELTRHQLLREGVLETRIRVTGNPGVSAISRYTAAKPSPALQTILVTLHRRELLSNGLPAVIHGLVESASQHPDTTFIWPIHPHVARRFRPEVPPNLHLLAPLPYVRCVEGLAQCLGTITDSGGIAEEAATLGVPAVHLRNVTDRPEAIDAGIAKCLPPTKEGISHAIDVLTQGYLKRRPSHVFGYPDSADHIAHHLSSL